MVLAGGAFNHSEQCCEGLMTERVLDNLFASKAFIGADSVDVRKELFFNGITGFGCVQKIIDNSKETILLADSSTWSSPTKGCRRERGPSSKPPDSGSLWHDAVRRYPKAGGASG